MQCSGGDIWRFFFCWCTQVMLQSGEDGVCVWWEDVWEVENAMMCEQVIT